jgi:hypothetical protein
MPSAARTASMISMRRRWSNEPEEQKSTRVSKQQQPRCWLYTDHM